MNNPKKHTISPAAQEARNNERTQRALAAARKVRRRSTHPVTRTTFNIAVQNVLKPFKRVFPIWTPFALIVWLLLGLTVACRWVDYNIYRTSSTYFTGFGGFTIVSPFTWDLLHYRWALGSVLFLAVVFWALSFRKDELINSVAIGGFWSANYALIILLLSKYFEADTSFVTLLTFFGIPLFLGGVVGFVILRTNIPKTTSYTVDSAQLKTGQELTSITVTVTMQRTMEESGAVGVFAYNRVPVGMESIVRSSVSAEVSHVVLADVQTTLYSVVFGEALAKTINERIPSVWGWKVTTAYVESHNLEERAKQEEATRSSAIQRAMEVKAFGDAFGVPVTPENYATVAAIYSSVNQSGSWERAAALVGDAFRDRGDTGLGHTNLGQEEQAALDAVLKPDESKKL